MSEEQCAASHWVRLKHPDERRFPTFSSVAKDQQVSGKVKKLQKSCLDLLKSIVPGAIEAKALLSSMQE
ncbi:hypothetical protein VULLAG_LOCUS13148 [Vulpes lagopus]